jgi:hypothetical protein
VSVTLPEPKAEGIHAYPPQSYLSPPNVKRIQLPACPTNDISHKGSIPSYHSSAKTDEWIREARAEGVVDSPMHSSSSPSTVKSIKLPASLRSDISRTGSKPSHHTSSKIDKQVIVPECFSQKTKKRTAPTKELLPITSGKSNRASPGNPISYVTLQTVQIRSGKPIHSNLVCILPRGTVLVINQIKGRSGRVVVQLENGEFEKVGWVTLYTYDQQQLLQKTQKAAFPFMRKTM